MTNIWLVRHGEAAAAWDQSSDPGLSPLGQEQAQRTALILHEQLPASVAIVSSPKARAQETCAPLLALRGAKARIDPAYTEVHAPVPLAERKQWLQAFMRQRWAEQPPPLWQWRQAITQSLSGEVTDVVIFTHFLVINAVLAECAGRDEVLQAWPANASVHHFCRSDDRLKLVLLGEQMTSLVN